MQENSDTNGIKILDCGAGGPFPKLSLFHEYGYDTYGIEILEERINKAKEYAENKEIILNIQKGDMRYLPYDSGYFDFVFSYNTIFHLNKKDIEIAIDEMYRVLKSGGLCYLNLLSYDDSIYGQGKEVNSGEFVEIYDGEEVMHTFFKDDEPDSYFDKFKILYKQKRTVFINVEDYHEGMLDFILKKEI
jgi:ubiquinone/menaquinone biosynthesis C-methylase UbiE